MASKPEQYPEPFKKELQLVPPTMWGCREQFLRFYNIGLQEGRKDEELAKLLEAAAECILALASGADTHARLKKLRKWQKIVTQLAEAVGRLRGEDD